MSANYETITLAGGCFWCLEAVYDEVKGVLSVDSGYANGHVPNPSYRDVCNGNTGHAEVVQVKFDPSVVTLRDLLNIFFTIHDPTTLNRQGGDVGTQYRSGIYYHSEEQKEVAEQTIRELEAQKVWDNPIVTEVEPLKDFYVAESLSAILHGGRRAKGNEIPQALFGVVEETGGVNRVTDPQGLEDL
jgi:peptide-methionine (S)-S-oxide reductase